MSLALPVSVKPWLNQNLLAGGFIALKLTFVIDAGKACSHSR